MNIPRHSTIVAYAALFTALGGTATAATQLARNSVGSPQIRNGSVTRADLAANARPASKARIAQAVTDVLADPATQVNIHVTGEKGDKGDAGSNGATVQGPQGTTGAAGDVGAKGADGAQGSTGPTGPPGDAQAFGVIRLTGTNGDGQFTANIQGATITHPGNGMYCLSAPAMTALTVTPDAVDTNGISYPPSDSRNTCPAGRFQVLMVNAHGQDVGFSFVGS